MNEYKGSMTGGLFLSRSIMADYSMMSEDESSSVSSASMPDLSEYNMPPPVRRTRLRKLADEKLPECPICNNPTTPSEQTQCKNGHMLCLSCNKKLPQKACPQCREPKLSQSTCVKCNQIVPIDGAYQQNADERCGHFMHDACFQELQQKSRRERRIFTCCPALTHRDTPLPIPFRPK